MIVSKIGTIERKVFVLWNMFVLLTCIISFVVGVIINKRKAKICTLLFLAR